MAVMASETPLNPIAPSAPFEKAQLPLDTSTQAMTEKPVNGDAPHLDTTSTDAPLDDNAAAVTKNGDVNMSNGDALPAPEPPADLSKIVSAEDESAAPVEHVEGGISGVAAFLPASTTNDDAIPPATAPPLGMTEPAPVEPTTSDARGEPLLPADPAQAVTQSEGPLPGEPSPAPVDEPAPAKAASTPPADKMDTTEDATYTEGEQLLNKPDEPMESVEPTATPDLSGAVSAIPGSAPAEESKPESPKDTAMTGTVRQREEDDDAEPAAKRAKTGSAEREPANATPAVPPTSEAPTPTAESSATATGATSTPISLAAQAVSANLPKPPPLDSNPMTPTQNKFLLEQIRKAKKTKSALAYLFPVDWAALNIPTYPEVIKHPMDLKTMEEKLKNNEYPTADDMMKDFEQMVNNSQIFNGPQHPVAQAGQSLRAYFIKCVSLMPKGEAAKAVEKPKKAEPAPPKVTRPPRQVTLPTAKSPTESKPAGFLNEHGMPIIRRDSSAQNDRPKREIHPPKRDLPSSSSRPKKKKAQLELKFCETVIAELHKKKHQGYSYAFLYPVDPVALNIPNYLKIIKRPMDFGTVQTNLKNGQYSSAKECYADCKLVFANCYKFNPPTDEVYKMGKTTEDVFDREWAKKDEWIANNMPPSEPATEDEEEEEEEEEGVEDPAIARMKEIQAQIAALSAEAMQLTNAPRKASPKAPGKTKKAKTAGAPKPAKAAAPAAKPPKVKKAPKPKRLTLDQKREVSEGIANLDETKMRKAVQIIRNGVPALANVQDDELELDIDEIPEDVVYKLWEFVKAAGALPKREREREVSPEYIDDGEDEEYEHRGRGGGGGAVGGSRRKNKPMKAQEQEDRIRQLQEKLQGGGGAGSGESQSPAAAGDGDESEGDSESSEEE